MIQRSLSLRILLVNFILLVLPLLLYFFIVFRTQYSGEIISAVKQLEGLASSRAALIGEIVENGFDSLSMIISLSDTNETATSLSKNKLINKELKGFDEAAGFDEIDYFEITDEDEYIIGASSTLEQIGNNYTFRTYPKEAVEFGQSSYLAVHSKTKNRELFLSKAIYNTEKEAAKPRGVMTLILPATEMLDRLVGTEFAPFQSRVSVLTRDGIVFVSSDDDFEMNALYPLSEERLRALEQDEQFGPYLISINTLPFKPIEGVSSAYTWVQNGESRIGVKVSVPGTKFSVFIDCSKDLITQGFYKHLWQLVVVISIVAILATLLNLVLTSRVSTPLKQLFNVMADISKGNLDKRYQNDPFGYEINKIGNTLNGMVTNLQATMDKVKSEKEERELLAKELKIGREIQMSILPQEMPDFPGIDLAAKSLPALEVGGDFYDLYVCKDLKGKRPQRLIASIGDGAGKGISACLYSVCLRSILRSYASKFLGVGRVMQLANNLFYLDTEKTSMFATAATIVFDEGAKKIDYSSAGHPFMIRKKGGEVIRIDPLDMAMGVTISDVPKEKELDVISGDLIVLYSDGVNEAQNQRGELYGEKRLANFLNLYGELPPQMILDDLYRDIELFCTGAKQWDDITVVIMRIV